MSDALHVVAGGGVAGGGVAGGGVAGGGVAGGGVVSGGVVSSGVVSSGVASGRVVGNLERNRGRLTLRYEQDWRDDPAAFPVSVSMPLAATEYSGDMVERFLWGLLPENPDILRTWGRQLGVRHTSAFELLSKMGRDCAGAMQFIDDTGLEDFVQRRGSVDWLEQDELNQLLRQSASPSPLSGNSEHQGRFSLAGAQAKVALVEWEGSFGVPHGSTPSTHVFKQEPSTFPGLAANEQLCQALALAVGMSAAECDWIDAGGLPTLVSRRYDRITDVDNVQQIQRIHQEDVCQALGQSRDKKYQNEGGPTPADVVALLRLHSDAPDSDIDRFIDALAFNVFIGGTDAHAKNYSLLIAPGGAVRLAPLYDLASFLPYDDTKGHKLKLAMKLGSTDLVDRILKGNWQWLAEECGIDGARALDRALSIGTRLIEVIDSVECGDEEHGLPLRASIRANAERALSRL